MAHHVGVPLEGEELSELRAQALLNEIDRQGLGLKIRRFLLYGLIFPFFLLVFLGLLLALITGFSEPGTVLMVTLLVGGGAAGFWPLKSRLDEEYEALTLERRACLEILQKPVGDTRLSDSP